MHCNLANSQLLGEPNTLIEAVKKSINVYIRVISNDSSPS